MGGSNKVHCGNLPRLGGTNSRYAWGETSQRLRCIEDKGGYSGGARHDWVWVQIACKRDGQEVPYKALQGRLPYRMLWLYELLVEHL